MAFHSCLKLMQGAEPIYSHISHPLHLLRGHITLSEIHCEKLEFHFLSAWRWVSQLWAGHYRICCTESSGSTAELLPSYHRNWLYFLTSLDFYWATFIWIIYIGPTFSEYSVPPEISSALRMIVVSAIKGEGEGEAGTKWAGGMDIYTLPNVK